MMPWVLGTGEGGMIFKLRNGREGRRYYADIAERYGAAAFLGEAIHQLFTLAVAQGEGDSYVPALAARSARSTA